jgi:hypothetical protein
MTLAACSPELEDEYIRTVHAFLISWFSFLRLILIRTMQFFSAIGGQSWLSWTRYGAGLRNIWTINRTRFKFQPINYLLPGHALTMKWWAVLESWFLAIWVGPPSPGQLSQKKSNTPKGRTYRPGTCSVPAMHAHSRQWNHSGIPISISYLSVHEERVIDSRELLLDTLGELIRNK